MTSASSERSATQFTVWPGNAARFANMDWNCVYQPDLLSVTGDHVRVFRCTTVSRCKKLLAASRSP